MHDQDHRRLGDEGDRREILDHVDGRVRRDRLVGDVGRRSHQKRVTILRRPRRGFGRDRRSRARLVLDDELLPENLPEAAGDDAPGKVGGGARIEADQDVHRAVRIILRTGGCRGGQDHQQEHGCQEAAR
jgi:hypothetical protein